MSSHSDSVTRPERERATLLRAFGGVGGVLRWLVAAGRRWSDANAPQLGASIAFYTMFALAPLLVITIAIAGLVFGPEAARGQIVGEIQGLVGTDAAKAIEAMIAAAWRRPGGLQAALLGIVTLLVGATGVFAELRRALNAIALIEPRKSVIGAFLRVRLTAFALLLGLGFLAIASLVLSAAVAALTARLSARYEFAAVLANLLDLTLSVTVLSVAFAALLRWLPDRPPSRRGVWLSAIATAVLFSIGKLLIGLYLGRASVASSYGAAGSFVVLMLWVYYSAQIMLFGAALGRVDDERRGVPPQPPPGDAGPAPSP
jgi:membrane protein